MDLLVSTVLIVSKTRTANATCIGAINLDNNKSVRLLDQDNHFTPLDAPYVIGDICQILYRPRAILTRPHLEDVNVFRNEEFPRLISRNNHIPSHEKIQPLIKNLRSIGEAFGGHLQKSKGESLYLPSESLHLVDHSTEFVRLMSDLKQLDNDQDHLHEVFDGFLSRSKLKYVGFGELKPIIHAGTVLRLSLPRNWVLGGANTPSGCYLQLSGWY